VKVIQLIQIFNKWTKIGVNIGICLGNNRDNF